MNIGRILEEIIGRFQSAFNWKSGCFFYNTIKGENREKPSWNTIALLRRIKYLNTIDFVSHSRDTTAAGLPDSHPRNTLLSPIRMLTETHYDYW